MIGSGIFFTPGQLATVATSEWQVYFFWALCGFITFCGAITLGEISSLLPRAGVIYHALTEAYGPFAGFMQAWMMVLVSGPGAIAGVAILFGELVNNALGSQSGNAQLAWASAAILFFAAINLRGAEWGGRTQIVLTAVKIIGLLALVGGGILLATPANTESLSPIADGQGFAWLCTLRRPGYRHSAVHLRRMDRRIPRGRRGKKSEPELPHRNGRRGRLHHPDLPAGELCVSAGPAFATDAGGTDTGCQPRGRGGLRQHRRRRPECAHLDFHLWRAGWPGHDPATFVFCRGFRIPGPRNRDVCIAVFSHTVLARTEDRRTGRAQYCSAPPWRSSPCCSLGLFPGSLRSLSCPSSS